MQRTCPGDEVHQGEYCNQRHAMVVGTQTRPARVLHVRHDVKEELLNPYLLTIVPRRGQGNKNSCVWMPPLSRENRHSVVNRGVRGQLSPATFGAVTP